MLVKEKTRTSGKIANICIYFTEMSAMLASSALKGGGNEKSDLVLGIERRTSLPPHRTPGDRQLVRELVLGQEDGEEERRRAQAQQDRAGVG